MLYLNIRPRMEELGITRYKLAKLIDVTYPTITAMYNGDVTSIKLENLDALCKALDCSPNDILTKHKSLLPHWFKASIYDDEDYEVELEKSEHI